MDSVNAMQEFFMWKLSVPCRIAPAYKLQVKIKTQGSSGAVTYPLGSDARLLAQSSFGGAVCPVAPTPAS
jgi:hypothetical protein